MHRIHRAPINRRSLLKLGLAAGGATLAARYSFAAPAASQSRFVFIIMRGALDGYFGLNPGLAFMHEAYGAHELLVLPCVATGYRERSHFDGQDVLENGMTQPHAAQTGWLNRALTNLPSANRRGRESGVALAQNVPLVLRGSAEVASWSPSVLPDLDEDTMRCIADRYASDPLLAQRPGHARALGRGAAPGQ